MATTTRPGRARMPACIVRRWGRPEGERCDDGNEVETDDCLSSCAPASCGDGVVHEGLRAATMGTRLRTTAAPCCVRWRAAATASAGSISRRKIRVLRSVMTATKRTQTVARRSVYLSAAAPVASTQEKPAMTATSETPTAAPIHVSRRAAATGSALSARRPATTATRTRATVATPSVVSKRAAMEGSTPVSAATTATASRSTQAEQGPAACGDGAGADLEPGAPGFEGATTAPGQHRQTFSDHPAALRGCVRP